MPVSLPQATAVQQDTQRNINVTVTQDGWILFEQEELPLALIKKRVGMEVAGQPDKVFVLQADKQVEYGQVINVLDVLKLAGARKVAVAAEVKAR